MKPLDQSETSCLELPTTTTTIPTSTPWGRGRGKELPSVLLCGAPGNEITDGLFPSWVGVSTPCFALSLSSLSFFSSPEFHRPVACALPSLPPFQPARTSRLSSPASKVRCIHTRIQMSRACGPSEVLLLLPSVSPCSICTTDGVAQPAVGSCGSLFLRGSSRPEGCASSRRVCKGRGRARDNLAQA